MTTRPWTASTSTSRGRPDSIGSRQPMRPSLPAQRSSTITAASAGRCSSTSRRSGSIKGMRPSKTTRGGSLKPSSVSPVGRAARWSGIRVGSSIGPRRRAGGTSASNTLGGAPRHVACVGELSSDVWLDIETRLILSTREPLTNDAGQPIPGQFSTTEVTEIAFGEQPAALFGPPEGVARMSEEAYGAYICARDLPNELVFELLGITESCPTEADTTPQPTPDTLRSSQPRSPAERSRRSTGVDPGESHGGLARAGPLRARRGRRERPADAPHVLRSHWRHRI